MPTALKWITGQAKHYRRAHPSMTWKHAIKKASMDYRSKHKTPKRKVARSLKVKYGGRTKAKNAVKRLKRLHRAEGKAMKAIGTVSAHLSSARKQLKEQIGWAEAQKFAAQKKSAKRKISKHITKLKIQYRKLI